MDRGGDTVPAPVPAATATIPTPPPPPNGYIIILSRCSYSVIAVVSVVGVCCESADVQVSVTVGRDLQRTYIIL